MTIAVLQEKLKTLPESCFAELFDFMEYLEYKNSKECNGLDIAIEEERKGEVETFSSFDDFKAEMSR